MLEIGKRLHFRVSDDLDRETVCDLRSIPWGLIEGKAAVR
jgi:hypothetical protein